MAKNKLFLRSLAVLLTVTMLAGLLPMSVFAAGNSGGRFTVEKVDNAPRFANLKNKQKTARSFTASGGCFETDRRLNRRR